MASYITPEDFVGPFKRPSDQYSKVITQDYIDRLEGALIRRIFGAEMGNEVLLYVTSSEIPAPVDVLLNAIVNPIYEDVNGRSIEYAGLKDTLLGFLWYEITVRTSKKPSMAGGSVAVKAEVSDKTYADPEIYCEAVRQVRAVQQYVLANSADYPNFRGKYFEMTWMI